MLKFDFVVMLTHDLYMDTIRCIDKTNPGYKCKSSDRLIEVYLNDKLVFVRFAPGSDTFATPQCANSLETFYQVSSIPDEFMIMPKAEKKIHLSTPKLVQDFFNNLSKYRRGELKIDNLDN